VVWDVEESGGEVPEKEQKLFALPALSVRGRTRLWFQYTRSFTDAFMDWAFEGESYQPINAHMFRRAYAVVYHYRYENATLLALSWQLRHADLGMTLHYFMDPPSRPLNERADQIWSISAADRSARIAHAREAAEEIELVGKEKLQEFVKELLGGAGRKFSGGFPILLTRFHQKLGHRLEYDRVSLKEQSEHLARLVLGRGHRPVPYWYGDCNAGPAKAGAGCHSKSEKRLAREKASPLVCSHCPYHATTKTHLMAMRREAINIKKEIRKKVGGIRLEQARLELEDLERAIAHHESRLE
jgi:hypothetical protein